MKKNQLYRLCLKSCSFQDTPVFKVKVGKFEKTVNSYFIQSDKQRYNYDLLFERSKEPEVIIEVFANQALIGVGKLKFDDKKSDLPNEVIDIMDNQRKKFASLEVSLKKIDKRVKKIPMKVKVTQASFHEDSQAGKNDSFIVVKYGDNNYKTKIAEGGGKTPEWKEEFHIGAGQTDRVFLEAWEDDGNGPVFLGLAILDIPTKLGKGQVQLEIMKEKKKVGMIAVDLTEHSSRRPDESQRVINDKNIIPKRTIKMYVVQGIMKKSLKKGAFVKVSVGNQEVETTQIFSEVNELKWNQSFTIKCSAEDELVAKICIKDDIEEEIGRCSLNVSRITNKKYELGVEDQNQKEIGKLYLDFYDEELDIKEEMSEPSQEKIQEKPEKSRISEETHDKIMKKNEEIKARYANRQSIHDYMADVNAVLQEGLLMIAKERPENPIRQLGLFLINYEK